MGLVLYALSYLFLIMLVLLVMIFFIPIAYNVEGIKEEDYLFNIKISWLGKFINFVINKEENKKIDFHVKIIGVHVFLDKAEKIKKINVKKDVKKQERTKNKKKKNFIWFFSFFQRPFIDKSFLFLKRIISHVLPKKYYFNLIYGFEDPADTGMLTGLFFMLFSKIPDSDIMSIHPVFDEEIIQGEVSIKGRIIIAVIFYYFLQFYFDRGIRGTLRKIRNK